MSVIKAAETQQVTGGRLQGTAREEAGQRPAPPREVEPDSKYQAACLRIEASVRTWGRGYDQGSIEKLRRFIDDAKLVYRVNSLHINGLTEADLQLLED
jgi:hypothetical protein